MVSIFSLSQGAQIIDLMMLVVDVVKGVQTQTAECLLIGELTCPRMVVVLNKTDLLPPNKRQAAIEKMTKRLHKTLESTRSAFNTSQTLNFDWRHSCVVWMFSVLSQWPAFQPVVKLFLSLHILSVFAHSLWQAHLVFIWSNLIHYFNIKATSKSNMAAFSVGQI